MPLPYSGTGPNLVIGGPTTVSQLPARKDILAQCLLTMRSAGGVSVWEVCRSTS